MEIKAEQKYLLLSPKKIRVVVDMIKKLKPGFAIDALSLVGKRAAEPLRKVIMQAVANAKVKGLSEADLIFKEIQVGEGPRLKRGQPVSRGQWHPIKKRMSHIRVVLITRNGQTPTSKSLPSRQVGQINPKIKNSKDEKELKKGDKISKPDKIRV